uniref:Carboxynorspermidine dehydrogenase n=1 Tax=Nonomuraea gerenzanensis TaxID=93944 RepID=A0A1M4EFE8_9ACTN|nr:Carboxynorspermidine dehydrogenase [Nonomuraea gerenzanensis]
MLVLGGYGAVGREAAAAAGRVPRHPGDRRGAQPERARAVSGATAKRVDAADPDELGSALEGVTTVLMCAEIDNARVARACLERGIHYVDVSASRHVLAAIEELDDLATARGAIAALSVGLVPGVTNLLAAALSVSLVAGARGGHRDLLVGVLLGSGEQHGAAAIAWTLDGLGALGLASARTGLCLDSRLMTGLLAAAGRPRVAAVLRRPRVRDLLVKLLGKVHLGGDGFAVTVARGPARAAFSGHSQSRATGRVAALLIRDLPALPPGVRHLEQLVDPAAFLPELAAGGFELHLPS